MGMVRYRALWPKFYEPVKVGNQVEASREHNQSITPGKVGRPIQCVGQTSSAFAGRPQSGISSGGGNSRAATFTLMLGYSRDRREGEKSGASVSRGCLGGE